MISTGGSGRGTLTTSSAVLPSVVIEPRIVNHLKTQLIVALMTFEHHLDLFQGVIDGIRQKLQCLQVFKGWIFLAKVVESQ